MEFGESPSKKGMEKIIAEVQKRKKLIANVESTIEQSPSDKRENYIEKLEKIKGRIIPKNLNNALFINEELNILLAFIKAESFIESNRIKPENFEFDDNERGSRMNEIKNNTDEAKRLEEKFEQETGDTKMYATILEAVISKFIGQGWMKNAKALNTSLYDDYINKVDIIAEIEERGAKKHLGLAVDATFSNKLAKKFNGIKKRLRDGQLGKIKYFKSGNYQGRLFGLPEVVVGVDINALREITILWNGEDENALKKSSSQKYNFKTNNNAD